MHHKKREMDTKQNVEMAPRELSLPTSLTSTPTTRGSRRAAGGRSFRRPGAADQNYNSFDVPGCVPIVAAPGDMIVWALRTYHAAFPLLDSWGDARHSANFGLAGSEPDLVLALLWELMHKLQQRWHCLWVRVPRIESGHHDYSCHTLLHHATPLNFLLVQVQIVNECG